MPNVQLPDGRVVQFPDGMSDKDIGSAIDSILGPAQQQQQQSLTQSPEPVSGIVRVPALAGSALVHGLATGLGLPGDLEQLGMQYGVNPLVRMAGGTPEDLSSAQTAGNTATFFPTSGQLVDLASRAGLTNRSDLAPTGALEKLGTGALEGLGSAVPMLATGGPVIPTLAAGAAGGLAGEGMHQLMPGNSVAPVVAGLGAGVGAQGLMTKLAGDSLVNEAKLLGSSATHQDAGVAIQAHAKDWIENKFPAAENAVWGPVDSALKGPSSPAGPDTPVDHLFQAVKDITTKGGAYAGAAQAIAPPMAQRILDGLTTNPVGAKPPGMPGARMMGPAGAASPPVGTWDDARALRSLIGNGLKDARNTTDQQNLEKMYSAVTEDLNQSAQDAGAGDLFSQANAESSRLRELRDRAIGPLVAPGVRPEDAASKALAGATKGGTTLGTLRGQIPDAVNELAAAHLMYNPKGWNRLSDEAKAALIPDPDQLGRINTAVAASLHGDVSPLTKAAEKLGGMGTGEIGGVLLNALFPHVDPIVAGAAGGAAGMLLPPLERAGRASIRNPRLPVTGALGAANALYPGPDSSTP